MSLRATNIGGTALVSALLATLTGCSGDEGLGSAATQRTLAEAQERDVAFTGRTELTLTGPPLAACYLYEEGGAEAKVRNGQVLATGTDGLVQFELEPTISLTKTQSLTFDCDTAEGIRTRSVVTFTGSDAPLEEMRTGPKREISGKLRPALIGDVMAYDQEYLIAHGYPPRPDASSPIFASWLRQVQNDMTIVDSGVVPAPGVRHADRRSNGWCGYVEYNATGHVMTDAGGDWTVPTVHATGRGDQYSSVWAGVDGTSGFSNDVILQAGTAQNVGDVGFAMLYVRYSWFEYGIHSGTDSTQIITNQPIHNGDEVRVDAYPCNSDWSISLTGQYGCMQIADWTDSTVSPVLQMSQRPSGGVFPGHSAEWILEAPMVDGQPTNLANFGTVTMTDPHEFTGTTVNDRHLFASGGGAYDKIVLEDNATNHVKLCGPTSPDQVSIQFKWYAKGTR